MGRKEQRIQKQFEKSPIKALNEIQTKYYPPLMQDFNKTLDPRNQSYITYSNTTMLATVYYKNVFSIESMQAMTSYFNKQTVVDNVANLTSGMTNEFLPHYVTLNEYLTRLHPSELEDIRYQIAYSMLRRKFFNDARFRKKWLVLIDGVWLDSGNIKTDGHCLEICHNKGTDKEKTTYYHSVLEAKIYFGGQIVMSIGSEFIENAGEDAAAQKEMSEEKRKQDCETKAFKRLAQKIKDSFPRLPICILGDSLYASEPVMDICEENGWEYIIRFKDGSIPTIAHEYKDIPEKNRSGNAEYVNGIAYGKYLVNMLKYKEIQVTYSEDRRCRDGKSKREKEEKEVSFQWITNIEITQKNAEKIASTGRIRWKIENEGFNNQKNWRGNISHACSQNFNALKCHYIMAQIADIFRILYEYDYLKKAGIIKTIKEISSDLRESFTIKLAEEDISNIRKNPQKNIS